MEQVKEVQATLEEEDSRLRLLKEKVDVRMFRLKVCRFFLQCDSRQWRLLVAGVSHGTGGEVLLCRSDNRCQRCPRIWGGVTGRLANGRRNGAHHLRGGGR